MRSKKRIFRQKSLTHCVVLYTTIWWLATHQPSHFKTRPLWSTKCLSSCLPGRSYAIGTLKGGEPYKVQCNLPSPKLPSSGLMEFYVSQMVCICFYSLGKIVHYTCNVEYTTRCACPASRLAQPLLGRKYSPDDLYSTYRPPLCRACWQCSLPPL